MSDNPPNTDTNAQDATPGNPWQTPTTSVWQVPQDTPQESGWRVTTLPQDLDEEPEEQGAWHLPKPEDTTFNPEDEIEITPPEDEIPTRGAPEDAAAGDTEQVAPEDQGFAPEDSVLPEDLLTAARDAEEEAAIAPEDQILGGDPRRRPPDDGTPVAPEDLIYMLENLDDEEDEDEGSVAMSELIALASLTQDSEDSGIIQGADSPLLALSDPGIEDTGELEIDKLTPAERLSLQGGQPLDPNDPASYAAQQLAQLAGEGDAGGTTQADAFSQTQATDPNDPSSYAARQLAQLGLSGTGESDTGATEADPSSYAARQLAQLGAAGDASGFTPMPDATQFATQFVTLTPEEQELAGQYEATEEQVSALRQQMQMGQISQEEFLAQLRNLMVLDNDNVWWIMGVETDTWYRAEGDTWVQATPDVLIKKQQAEQAQSSGGFGALGTGTGAGTGFGAGAGTQFGGFDQSLPYLGDQPQPTQQVTGGSQVSTDNIRLDENNMPLPQAVPITDPDATVPNQGAFATSLGSSAETMPGQSYYDATVPSTPQVDDYIGIESPLDDTEPPDYDTLSDETGELYEEAAEKRRTSQFRTATLVIVGLIVLAALGGAVFIGGALLWYNNLLSPWEPAIAALEDFDPGFATVTLLDNAGERIATLTREGEDRREVDITQVSPYVIHAILTLENRTFFDDPGWNFFSTLRAFYDNFLGGEVVSGGSTITQQVARNLVLQNTDATADRKLNEIIVAGEITNQYDKNEILELYLNDVTFFGNQTYGIEAAAQFYFNKPALELNWPEAALIASIISAPATNEPVNNRENSLQLMEQTMDAMVENGCQQVDESGRELCITQGDRNSPEIALELAQVLARRFNARESGVRYPHFTQRVQAELEDVFGSAVYSQGYIVTTTLDSELQDFVQTSLQNRVAELSVTGVNTGAAMVTDPRNGAILAMVGSPDFNNEDIAGQVNGALTWQQPGSAIKPIIYAAALSGIDLNGNGAADAGEYYTPSSILWDVPSVYGNYVPVNIDGRFRGPVNVRNALQNSYNIPAIKAYDFIGTENFQRVAAAMGIDFLPEAEFNLTTALGSTDVRLINMMSAYGTIANDGMRMPLFTIESIEDPNGNPVPIPARAEPTRALTEAISFLMQDILTDDAARADQFGVNSALTISGIAENAVGAKTGTTDNSRDLWTMGFTSNRVVGVWLGTFDDAPTFNTTGFTATAPLWNTIMRRAIQGTTPGQFVLPGGGTVVTRDVCLDTGTVPGDNCPRVSPAFFAAAYPPPPPENGPVVNLRIDSWLQIRANDLCPDQQIVQTFANIDDPFAIEWINTSAEGRSYANRVGLSVPVEQAPQAQCTTGVLLPQARIAEPNPGSVQTVQGNLSILGLMSAENFNRYQIEFAPVNSENFQIIQQPADQQLVQLPSTQQQINPNSVLGIWDTTTVPNGDYTIRLAAFSNDGGFLYRTSQVVVNNPAPTATPTVQPTATLFPTSTAVPTINNPLPFDELSGPTPTLDPLGG